MTKSISRKLAGSVLAAASLLALPACESAVGADMQSPAMASEMTVDSVRSMVSEWPEGSSKAAMAMIEKYGMPDGVTPTLLTWSNSGPWKWTRVFRDPVQHDFPMPHPDVLEQAINYDAPVDMFDELARYDGSVIVERTKGQMSARCDKEGANFLAINLANDVVTRQRTVEEARDYYARAMKTFMETNEMDPYMQGLAFQPPASAGDPGQSVM